MASPTQWLWVWENFRKQWRTGKPGVLQSMGLQSCTQLSDRTITIHLKQTDFWPASTQARCSPPAVEFSSAPYTPMEVCSSPKKWLLLLVSPQKENYITSILHANQKRTLFTYCLFFYFLTYLSSTFFSRLEYSTLFIHK